MFCPLAYADVTDNSQSNMLLLILGPAIIATVALAATVVIFFARRRNPRRFEAITTGIFFWAVAAAGTILYVLITQLNWQKEKTLRLQSGYYSPDQIGGDAPKLPWAILGILLAAYVLLLIVSLRRQKSVAS